MEEPIVKVENLSHRYSVHWAIRDINFEINMNGIYGLLGSNGAGKSTTMNIMCGVLKQTEGDVYIKGISMRENPVEAKKHIGFLPQFPPLHPDLTVSEMLEYSAELRHIPDDKVKSAIGEAMERCGISHFAKRVIRNLSGGYKQRVGIAQAIIHNPDFVILDEPTNGLDIPSKSQFRKLLASYATDERTILISTHQVRDLESLLDHLIVMDGKKLLLNESVARITERLCFDEVRPGESIEQTLVAYPSLGGSQVVSLNTSRRETAFNLECFFNALLEHREQIMNALK